MAEVAAAVYLRTPDHARLAEDAVVLLERFAETYEFQLVVRHQDTVPIDQPQPGPAFTRLLDDLDDGRAVYVLVPSRDHLSPDPAAQRELAALIARAGGVLIDATAANSVRACSAGRTPTARRPAHARPPPRPSARTTDRSPLRDRETGP